MMYPYMTLPDETLITHSHLLDENGTKTVEVHFERPKDVFLFVLNGKGILSRM